MYNGDESEQNIVPTPILSDKAREDQIIADAYNVAAEQIRNGTASAMVLVHFLKLGSEKEKLEKEKLRRENELLRSKVDAYEQAKKTDKDYANVIAHLKLYRGEKDVVQEDIFGVDGNPVIF